MSSHKALCSLGDASTRTGVADASTRTGVANAKQLGSEHAVEGGYTPLGSREEIEHETVLSFFAIKENQQKLRALSSRHTREVIVYFLTHFDQSELEPPPGFDIAYRYRCAITGNRKKFFDFLVEPGKGEFFLRGARNPGMERLENLTVPCLAAIRWFIMNQIDESFKTNRALIETRFQRFKIERGMKYRENSMLKLSDKAKAQRKLKKDKEKRDKRGTKAILVKK